MLPNFVIIGAQKSASSFLQACLAEHPEIYMPHGETPFFESPDYENSNIQELKKIFEGRKEKRYGIKRPNYIGKPEVPARLEYHLPNAKLIAVLRNPIERAISAYFHQIKSGTIPSLNVEAGMRKVMLDPSFSQKYKRSAEIIEFGKYYKYLSKYSHYINNNQILFFLHEDIKREPLNSVQRAYDFLDVSSDYVPNALTSQPQMVLYNLTRLRFLTLRNKFIYEYNRDRTRVYPKISMIGKIFNKAIVMLDSKILSIFLKNVKPQISAELEAMLYERYAKDIYNLERLIGRDLNVWR